MPLDLSDLPMPTSSASRAALEVITNYAPPALLNHSIRSYIWAVAYAHQEGLEFDAELLYVSSMLHDLTLVKEFDSYALPFEDAGGHVAWVFGAAAGWSVARRKRAAEIIVRHMWDSVDVKEDPEGHLLELGTAMDVSGRQAFQLDDSLRGEVLERYPRLGLPELMIKYFNDQANRKPNCLAAKYIASGFVDRVNKNPLDR